MVKGQPQRFVVGHENRGRRLPQYRVDEETGCWVWLRKITHGYAYMELDGKTIRAARWYYEQAKGPISDGLTIDHVCPHGPNKACVNPDHLEAVTQAVNTRRRTWNKLNETMAAEIRALAGTMSQRAIAERFGVDPTSVSKIVNGHTWRP